MEKPDLGNKIQVSLNNPKGFKFYVYISKVLLKKHGTIEIHGVGQAISRCVQIAETLNRFGYSATKKIEVLTIEPGAERKDEKGGKKVKIIIKLGKSDQFDKLASDIILRPNPPPKT